MYMFTVAPFGSNVFFPLTPSPYPCSPCYTPGSRRWHCVATRSRLNAVHTRLLQLAMVDVIVQRLRSRLTEWFRCQQCLRSSSLLRPKGY